MIITEYISTIEALNWENSLELFHLMKGIPVFEDKVSIVFKIIKNGEKHKLKLVESRTFFYPKENKEAEGYVEIYNFLDFVIVIETIEAGITFKIKNGQANLINVIDFEKYTKSRKFFNLKKHV